jgi:hypothetical protein
MEKNWKKYAKMFNDMLVFGDKCIYLFYILDLWTTSLKTKFGFRFNTLFGYQVFLTKNPNPWCSIIN